VFSVFVFVFVVVTTVPHEFIRRSAADGMERNGMNWTERNSEQADACRMCLFGRMVTFPIDSEGHHTYFPISCPN
jgi:hypothetical protein